MQLTRRLFLKNTMLSSASLAGFSVLSGCLKTVSSLKTPLCPNVLVVLTDDQGFGDLSLHGNPDLNTPAIDNFAKEGVEFTNFYVCPVCSPTRASLMTGRYHMRTGVVDTYMGRSMMYNDEVTIAEYLKGHGYTTGIFGKWHLGDNYPLRPQDQGFDEVVVFRGGGIGQPSDPPGGNSYFDPVLQHNGKTQKYKGYCMDVYTDLTIDFVKAHKNKPFFAYLATNTPHSPLQVPDEYLAKYSHMQLQDKTARVYGMVKNIDDNFKRLLAAIEELGLAENTIVIFMSDNGPCPSSIQKDRHMAGLRGQKATVYENGIKVPFFIRWPKGFKGNRKIDWPSAHIDVVPTLLGVCGIPRPSDIDGVSLMPLISSRTVKLAERNLYFQCHRGDMPELYRAFAVRGSQYKLVQAAGWEQAPESEYKFELFDIVNDPFEKIDIASKNPQMVEDMKASYKKWFDDVSSSRGFKPPRIIFGTAYENPTVLTRQDWRGAKGWDDSDIGYWETQASIEGKYSFVLCFSRPVEKPSKAKLEINGRILEAAMSSGQDKIMFNAVDIAKGNTRIKGWVQTDNKLSGVRFIDIYW